MTISSTGVDGRCGNKRLDRVSGHGILVLILSRRVKAHWDPSGNEAESAWAGKRFAGSGRTACRARVENGAAPLTASAHVPVHTLQHTQGSEGPAPSLRTIGGEAKCGVPGQKKCTE